MSQFSRNVINGLAGIMPMADAHRVGLLLDELVGGSGVAVNLASAQTITGAKTFANQTLKLRDPTATAITIAVASLGDPYTYTLPDSGANASFVMTAGNQSIGGVKTFSDVVVSDTFSITGVTFSASNSVISMLDNQAIALAFMEGANHYIDFCTTNSAEAIILLKALASTPPANQTLTNGATITLPAGFVKVVDNGGAVTGILMTAGIKDGQMLHIVNAAAASVTFAASGTSLVADGTSAVIDANRAITLIYDLGSLLWYRTG